MKSVVDAAAFASALKKAGMQKRGPKKERMIVRADFGGGVCRLTGSNFSAWLTVELPAEGDSFSFVFLDAGKAVRICGYLRGLMEVELSGNNEEMELALSCGDKSGFFQVKSAWDYPLAPQEAPIFEVNADAKRLVERINSIRYAVSTSMDKASVCGVWFRDDSIWAVDGYRLAISRDKALKVDKPFAVRASLLEQIQAFDSETISIALGKSYVAFSGSEVRLVCRHLKSESGLDLDKILPANPKEQYTIDRQQYLSALNYLAECARGTERPCVRYERGLLELSGDHCYYAARIDTTGENDCRICSTCGICRRR